MANKLIDLIMFEILVIIVFFPMILFKHHTDNIFFPDVKILILLNIIFSLSPIIFTIKNKGQPIA